MVPAPGVFVVEDDDATRETIRLVLEDAGYVVSEATGGARALERLRASPEHFVVLLDSIMPGVDGLQVLRAAAAEALVGRHAYILDTTDATAPSPELSDLLTRLQVSTLLKPFDIDRLLELVAAAAERLA